MPWRFINSRAEGGLQSLTTYRSENMTFNGSEILRRIYVVDTRLRVGSQLSCFSEDETT